MSNKQLAKYKLDMKHSHSHLQLAEGSLIANSNNLKGFCRSPPNRSGTRPKNPSKKLANLLETSQEPVNSVSMYSSSGYGGAKPSMNLRSYIGVPGLQGSGHSTSVSPSNKSMRLLGASTKHTSPKKITEKRTMQRNVKSSPMKGIIHLSLHCLGSCPFFFVKIDAKVVH